MYASTMTMAIGLSVRQADVSIYSKGHGTMVKTDLQKINTEIPPSTPGPQDTKEQTYT